MAERQERFAPDAEFRYVGGDPSLDFVNTADWTDRGLERDRLTSYTRVLEWARGAGMLRIAEERKFSQLATSRPRLSTAALEQIWAARQVLQRILQVVTSGRTDPRALDELNARISDAGSRVSLLRGADRRFTRTWCGFGDTLDSVLWPVIWSATELLASGDATKLRQCGGDDCGWFFVDRSRTGRRRWCEMSVCGTTEKNRRRARRS